MRPGWGVRHPVLGEILRSSTALAVEETRWVDSALRLRVSAHAPLVDLPNELVVSARCLVTVKPGRIVLCTNADGSHPWPGGRREPGETLEATACREVHEETGWIIEPDSLRALGWLHFEHLATVPANYRYPHPDFVQVVLTGHVSRRDGGHSVAWTDTDGYEASSRLVALHDVPDLLAGDRTSQLARPFLDLL